MIGHSAFDAYVQGRLGSAVEPEFSGSTASRARTQARAALRLPLEVSSVLVPRDQPAQCQLLYPARHLPAGRWEGDLTRLLELAAARLAVAQAQMCSPSKRRRAVQARRVVLVAGAWLLRRPQKEVAAALGLSSTPPVNCSSVPTR